MDFPIRRRGNNWFSLLLGSSVLKVCKFFGNRGELWYTESHEMRPKIGCDIRNQQKEPILMFCPNLETKSILPTFLQNLWTKLESGKKFEVIFGISNLGNPSLLDNVSFEILKLVTPREAFWWGKIFSAPITLDYKYWTRLLHCLSVRLRVLKNTKETDPNLDIKIRKKKAKLT